MIQKGSCPLWAIALEKLFCCLINQNLKLFLEIMDDASSIRPAWLHRGRVCVLDWAACSPDLLPTENIWFMMKYKIQQRKSQDC